MEIMPLVDVIFLLLTFFVFAMVLMVRADVLDVALPAIGAGQPVERERLITIAMNETGEVFLDGARTTIESLGEQVSERLADREITGVEARVVIAADSRSQSGALLRALDALAASGIRNVAIMGRPEQSEPAGDAPETSGANEGSPP